ncbi:hypothetical protein [Aggregatilinea lenta]|uniref:hypothetical protein n=1 Tax=Aggregatilinea lenta TaxID=913108 RepID=UPI000E5B0E96|nr:hypothetical protein [Aggregatilinea lenta]
MAQHESLENLFEQALEALPFGLEVTSVMVGELEPDSAGFVEYLQGFTFTVGQLFDMDLIADGWVALWQEDSEINISAFIDCARDGDGKKGLRLPEDTVLEGGYDLENQTWEFWIDH